RKYDRAIRLLNRSLVIRERAFGAESSQVADTLHELANLYQAQRQYEKSEPLYLRSITIQEKILGRSHPDTVNAMKDFACLLVRNKSIPIFKEEVTQELTAAEIEQRSVMQRANCWLYGFTNDCDKQSYKPRTSHFTVLNGKAIRLAQPGYPVEARRSGASGRVYVAIRIDEEGNVADARAICGGHPALARAAVEAARSSRFTATVLEGKAVRVSGIIIYNFVSQY
ncbi:MAG: TonB family protein, partial [Acidobacteriota bacterium]